MGEIFTGVVYARSGPLPHGPAIIETYAEDREAIGLWRQHVYITNQEREKTYLRSDYISHAQNKYIALHAAV